jgi:hypothetical protein
VSEEHGYIDSSIPEAADAKPISYPGVKLSPNEHSDLYDDVQGMSEARPQPEKPKVARPLRLSVRRRCEPPQDDERIELGAFGIYGSW